MPALVDTMYSVRTAPWHKQGVVLADYPGSWPEARKAAGIDWDVLTEPIYTLTGVDPDTGNPTYAPITGHKQVVRSDTGKTLSVVNESYTLIDHTAMGGIIEAVLKQANVKYETAGSLDDGRAVWCLARLDEPIQLPGDNSVTMPFLAITNRHDAMGACALRATAVRIVCMNTFRAAEMEGERTGATFSFRHTRNWKDRIEEAREAVTGTRREMAEYVELATELLGHTITAPQRELFVKAFIPTPPESMISDRVATNIEQARNSIRLILQSETTAAVAHTAYGLVQAAGEYLDHVRVARTWETRLGRTLLRPEEGKRRALNIARQVMAAGA